MGALFFCFIKDTADHIGAFLFLGFIKVSINVCRCGQIGVTEEGRYIQQRQRAAAGFVFHFLHGFDDDLAVFLVLNDFGVEQYGFLFPVYLDTAMVSGKNLGVPAGLPCVRQS